MKFIVYPLVLLSAAAGTRFVSVEDPPRRIGSTETITEVNSGLPFIARVNTGAHSCSIHCDDMEIENAAEDPSENIGKQVRFLVKNKQ